MKLSCRARRLAAKVSLPRPTWNYYVTAGLWVLVLSMPGFCQGTAPIVSCESMAKLALPDTTITMAEAVAAGEFRMPPRRGGPAPDKVPGVGPNRHAGGDKIRNLGLGRDKGQALRNPQRLHFAGSQPP